jgi:cytosine permease
MASSLPDYVAAARPVPQANRAAWYKNVAQTYAGVMLWYVFWQEIPGGGSLDAGVWPALLGLLLAGLICHFLFYLVPGLLGMKTGLPLYVVGTSTYGTAGGLIMPGLLMGLLQFGWLGVNAYSVAELLYKCLGGTNLAEVEGKLQMASPDIYHALIVVVFAVGVAYIGLKGIQYVARVASFFPLIPIAVLLILLVSTISGLGKFKPEMTAKAAAKPAAAAKAAAGDETAKADTSGAGKSEAPAKEAKPKDPLSALLVIVFLCNGVAGFFATAGAAGTDLAMNSRNEKDVQSGGLTGIALATLFAGGIAVLVVAGRYGQGDVPAHLQGNLNPLDLMSGDPVKGGGFLSPGVANVILILLAISAFPGGCFSAFIAANSFKTTMPKVNPFLSVGLGTLVSIVLAVTLWAGKVKIVFAIIGCCFGPICGAMAADYLLSGMKWPGPRAGFNPAGWISWAVGFVVGAADFIPFLKGNVPAPTVSALLVGFVLYVVLAKAGLESKTVAMPRAAPQKA